MIVHILEGKINYDIAWGKVKHVAQQLRRVLDKGTHIKKTRVSFVCGCVLLLIRKRAQKKAKDHDLYVHYVIEHNVLTLCWRHVYLSTPKSISELNPIIYKLLLLSDVLGDIEPGLPTFRLPPFQIERQVDDDETQILNFSDICAEIGAMGIALFPLVSILEQVAIAKTYCRFHHYAKWSFSLFISYQPTAFKKKTMSGISMDDLTFPFFSFRVSLSLTGPSEPTNCVNVDEPKLTAKAPMLLRKLSVWASVTSPAPLLEPCQYLPASDDRPFKRRAEYGPLWSTYFQVGSFSLHHQSL